MRAVNRVASAVLGALLIVVGLAVVVEMALVAAGRSPSVPPLNRWYAWMTTTTLDDSRVLATAIVVGLIGVVLLILELRPWPPDRLLAGEPQDKTWWVSRRSVERRTATAAATAAGVHQAHADVRGRSRNWRLRLRAEGWPEQREAVEQAVRAELTHLSAPAQTPISITLRRPRGRVA